MTVTWPTVLTFGRLLCAPAIALLFLAFPRPWADGLALVLFVGASATDWLDGVLARKWGQVSRLGTMLDPIADKAMVVLTLMVLMGLYGVVGWIALPAIIIVFREVFVSGLREFLGAAARSLAVTPWAKIKTGVQMVGIAVLLIHGIFAHHAGMLFFALGEEMAAEILAGRAPDDQGLRSLDFAVRVTWWGGIVLLWAAAILTAWTGWDYFTKARPHLSEVPQ